MPKAAPWAPRAVDRALAASLGPGSAFLPHGDGWVHVTGAVGPGRRPLLDLAQAIWERDPGQARAALRPRVRLTDPVDPVDRAIADVVARRTAFVAGEAGATVASDDLSAFAARARARAVAATVDPGQRRVPADQAGWLAALVPTGAEGPLAVRDRPVVAVLVDPAGFVHRATRNAAGTNRTLHAEICLVQGFGAIPAGWTVLTSLQSCRMCAAILVEAATGPIDVAFLEADPGRLATRTALQARGWERALGDAAP